jgi:hypothetical protein
MIHTIFATLVTIGNNRQVIWQAAAAVLTVLLTAVIIVAGVSMIRRLINSV